ncbi:hypothetical protein N7495_000924 [Penicillium taxi]|uniref:uncharacterized protein n=1 Tax=Penicillium taxi TaxID=168475 RepID=UPI002544F45B|nr:uncharacterized protein N7495_000924 [Penicillium taxi]KAJ5908242.1 hypothetical protein N7495_000924 [Penicillium taxi]
MNLALLINLQHAHPLPLTGRSLAIFAFTIALLTTCVIAVLLRCFVRGYLLRAFGWDDRLMLMGLILFIGMSTCLITASTRGLGHHITDFPDLVLYRDASLWWWVSSEFYVLSSAFTKGSVTMTLLRLSVKNTHRYILWVVAAVIIISTFLFFFTWLLVCYPISYYWDRVLPDAKGHCVHPNSVFSIGYIYSVLSLLADLTLGILPLFLVYDLQMNALTKLATGGILSLGAVYGECGIAVALFQVIICTTAEVASTIIAGSLITLRPLFRWLIDPKMLSSKRKMNRHDGSDSYTRAGHVPLNSAPQDDNYQNAWRLELQESGRIVMVAVPPSQRDKGSLNGDCDSSDEHLNPPDISRVANVEETTLNQSGR